MTLVRKHGNSRRFLDTPVQCPVAVSLEYQCNLRSVVKLGEVAYAVFMRTFCQRDLPSCVVCNMQPDGLLSAMYVSRHGGSPSQTRHL